MEALPCNPIDEPPCNIVDNRNIFIGKNSIDVTPDFIFWTFYFDDSNCLEGAATRSILVDAQGNQHLMASHLEFMCTNNMAEYEGLLQGLKKAIDMKVKKFKVFGDSEIIVDQVRKRIHYNSPHLVRYQHEVWSLIDSFDSFNITYIPRGKNQDADLMAGMVAKILPNFRLKKNKCYAELIFRPSIPDNITYWRVFNNDSDIIYFLTFEGSHDSQI